MTKAERLAVLRTEKPQPAPPVQQEKIQLYGDTAVRRILESGEWVLEVWVKQVGAWRVAAVQLRFAKP